MLKVVIIGYGEMFTNLIAATLDAKCEVVGVLRKETIKYNRVFRWIKDLINPSFEYNYIKSYNLPEIQTKSINSKDFRKKLLNLNPDIILVGSWGERFEKETYSIPKIATINAHPSLLPKYRGPNPYFWAIRNREKISGITLHLMDKGYDTGAILAQREVKISPDDTGETLKKRTVLIARGLTCDLLNTLKEDIIIPLQQREDRATYYSNPNDLCIDFRKTATENLALIKASYPWCKTYFHHNITALTPNPHKTTIEDYTGEYKTPGTIIDIDIKSKTLKILCADTKVLNLSDISLYRNLDKPFTKNYIIRDIKIGDIID